MLDFALEEKARAGVEDLAASLDPDGRLAKMRSEPPLIHHSDSIALDETAAQSHRDETTGIEMSMDQSVSMDLNQSGVESSAMDESFD